MERNLEEGKKIGIIEELQPQILEPEHSGYLPPPPPAVRLSGIGPAICLFSSTK